MRLKKAKEYVERILPVLVEHIRENYCPDFVAPEIEFDNSWISNGTTGAYYPGYKKIKIKREGRMNSTTLVRVLAHELGHALLDQVNPEFYWINMEENRDYNCLSEGIAEAVEDGGVEVLQEEGLYSPSIFHKLRIDLNDFLNPVCWVHEFSGTADVYREGDKSVKRVKKTQSLVEIMEQAHKPEFVNSIMRK